MIGRSLAVGVILAVVNQWVFAEPAAKTTGSADSTVLMSKGKTVVTQADFEAQLQDMPEEVRFGIRSSMDRLTKVLDNLYVRKQLAQEAREGKLDQDPLVRRRIELAVDQVLAQARLDSLVEQAPPPDLEALAKEQYLVHPEMAQLPEEVRVSHILIGTQKRSEQEAKQLAEKVLAEVIAGKQPFVELAKKYSEDPASSNKGGDLGFFGRGRMIKPFEDAAFAMKQPGEIGPLVKSEFGFHIIRYEGRNPPRKMSFDEVKTGIAKQQKDKYLTQAREDFINKMMSPEGVHVNTEAIQRLYSPIPDISKKPEPAAPETRK